MELENDPVPSRVVSTSPAPLRAPRRAVGGGEPSLADEIVRVVRAVAEGDLTQRVSLAVGRRASRTDPPPAGVLPRLGSAVNAMVQALAARELSGHDGGDALPAQGAAGPWAHSTLDAEIARTARVLRDVGLPEIIDFVDRSFRPLAEQKQLTYTTEVPVGLPRVRTDPRWLRQLLENLLANALQLTERGSITLRIHRPDPGTRFSSVALERESAIVAFSVIDTGLGIAEKRRRLGAARQLARLLGGEIHVEDDIDRGSTCTLYLPERASPEAVSAERTQGGGETRGSLGPGAHPEGRRVLVIDDDVRSTFAVTSVLESHGHSVVYAEGLGEGRDAVLREPDIDLVLVDVKAIELAPAHLDGYQALRLLRAEPRLVSAPIVATGYPLTAPISAAALEEHRVRCLDAGASDYLPKPLDPDAVLDLVRQRTRGGGGARAG